MTISFGAASSSRIPPDAANAASAPIAVSRALLAYAIRSTIEMSVAEVQGNQLGRFIANPEVKCMHASTQNFRSQIALNSCLLDSPPGYVSILLPTTR